MSSPTSAPTGRSILIIGASRGMGYAMAAEFAGRGWGVLGTVRAPGTPLHSLAAERPDAVEIETLDMTDHDQILAMRDRLSDRQFDIVFINGGIANRAPSDTMAGFRRRNSSTSWSPMCLASCAPSKRSASWPDLAA